MVPLIGYTDKLSARPGEKLEFKISCKHETPVKANLVRTICADPNPEGPGLTEEDLSSVFETSIPSRVQDFHPGSLGLVEEAGVLSQLESASLVATIWPTTPRRGPQTILALEDGLALGVDQEGCITGRLGGQSLTLSIPLRERYWYRVWVSFDAPRGVLAVGQFPLNGLHQEKDRENSSGMAKGSAGGVSVTIAAASHRPTTEAFNGKIEAPMIFSDALAAPELSEGTPTHDPIAHWDFSRGISSSRIEDVGPHGLHGQLINHPARAMTGSNWHGGEMCWRHAPEEYGAIHFHDDDIYAFEWESDIVWTVPADLRSGVYGLRLECEGNHDTIPFFVPPPRGQRKADLAVLVSVFTYVIYGNNARVDFNQDWRDKTAAWGGYPHNPKDYIEYGCSTYNYHSDRSGICHASHLRPLINMRPGYITFGDAFTKSGLRHFQADSHLIAWLEDRGIDYDIITDHELQREGAAALEGYKAVTTGSHPEYHTPESLNALQDYRDNGGNFLYLGGNGFYWRVALHAENQAIMEIRRGEGGIRAWAAEPGEYYNAFDGQYGGLWRRNGRPPQQLAGIGFSAQGKFQGSYYRRREGILDDPRVAWIFEGIEDQEILGDFGLCGGGAAGFELDRADTRLGTPEEAIVLASSEAHQEHFVLVPEEQLTHFTNLPGEANEDLIRADMIYFDTPAGGAVFASGSITFCGSLLNNNSDNNISRLLENVLRRFLGH